MRILVTGSAGFIGFHVSKNLAIQKHNVLGLDSLNDYYDPELKGARLKILKKYKNFSFKKIDISEFSKLKKIFEEFNPNFVIHLAAQAGVRYSIDHPDAYVKNNLIGTFNILEISKNQKVKHLMIASTSSVYGANKKMPFEENQKTDLPLSFYSATKKSNEAMAHSYSHLFKIPITIFRFFTVYGPWGRPDMALFKFTKSMLKNKPIEVFNYGKMERDFTYIDDLTGAIIKLLREIPKKKKFNEDSISPVAPYRIVNIGNSKSEKLSTYIKCLEKELNLKAKKNLLPMQPGDVKKTLASNKLLKKLISDSPNTPIKIGVRHFVEWYKEYYLD
tara:strand:+ start:3952 stop:4947 length:996 start_codon:yes stop_codon:yes gene_type:complete